MSAQHDATSVVHAEEPAVRAYPANVTFHDLIRANKRKSVLLMIGMTALLVLIGAAIAAALAVYGGADAEVLVPAAITGAVAAALTGVLASLWSYYGGSSAILRMSGAKEIQKHDDPQLFNVVEELSIAAGVPLPRVFLIDDTALNAFATGRDPAHAAVAITTGLRAQLTRDELAAVMAHELSHVRHYDIRFAMLMATMVGLIVFACDAFWRMIRLGYWTGAARGGRRGGKSSGGGGIVVVVILVIAILLAIIAPTLAMMIRFAVSRQREYLADAGAVELTRYPQGLIGALKKLGACREPLEAANRATAHLYIVNPLKSAQHGRGHELSSIFRTHPPLHERIERLQALLQ